MSKLRILLLPFSWCYGIVVGIRNLLYDSGIFKSYKIPKHSIVVGNLSTGGTGKTPLVDYLITYFKERNVKTASLSRGYGRKTSGLRFASDNSTSDEIGDEPLLYQMHHGKKVQVVVAEKRKEGVIGIYEKFPQTELIILDDAFQHRAVTAGMNILVTEFNKLYCDDFLLPAGNLREWKSGAKRADIIVVSKSPENCTQEEKNSVIRKLKFKNDNIFFSTIKYGPLTPFSGSVVPTAKNILLVTGIGNPAPLLRHLKEMGNVKHLSFSDHHDFKASDIQFIHENFDTFASHDKMIVTTEKDYMRLRRFGNVFTSDYPWFYQPITIDIDQKQKFNRLLETHVRKN